MASELKLNRKADVAITILVIGVFAICALAIIIFIISNQQTQNNFVSTDTLENLSSSLETFYFYTHTHTQSISLSLTYPNSDQNAR